MKICLEEMKLEDLSNITLADFDNFWNENMLKEELLNPSSYYIVAKCENDILGFAGINLVLDEAHIANIVTKISNRNSRNSAQCF